MRSSIVMPITSALRLVNETAVPSVSDIIIIVIASLAKAHIVAGAYWRHT